MKIKKTSIPLMLCTLGFYGCSDDQKDMRSDFEQDLNKEAEIIELFSMRQIEKNTKISQSEATRIVNNIFSKSNSLKAIKALSFEYVTKSSGLKSGKAAKDTTMYLINIGNQEGYAIISGDWRAGDILGFSESGSISMADTSINCGLADFLKRLPAYCENEIASFEKKKECLEAKYKNHNVLKASDTYEWQCDFYDWGFPSIGWTKYWHQQLPYNFKMGWNQNTGKRQLAGCLPIAMAEIMTWHKYPQSINGKVLDWNLINKYNSVGKNPLWVMTKIDESTVLGLTGDPEKIEYREQVSTLVKAIADKVVKAYGDNYTTGDLNKCTMAFKDFGYNCSKYKYYNYERPNDNSVITSLKKEKLPIIASTAAHAWVIDDYLKQNYINKSTKQVINSRYLVHCNWGYTPTTSSLTNSNPAAGYYVDGVFSGKPIVCNYEQSVNQTGDVYIVYNIYPENK